jgi:hypothetical protein|tara:strand:- start:3608 stop:4810 length:1203 start_codon:yes stop_codon:yes gene_type:complete
MSQILNNKVPQLVSLITREMTSREDKKKNWARFKKVYDKELCEILGVDPAWGLQAGSLIGFDIDEDRKLILLNYSASAHNLLHEIDGGWSPVLRQMRGLVYAFETPGEVEGVRLVSRGFEKFFNQSELPETSLDVLASDAGNIGLFCTAKEDGHMIEYFMHDRKLCATTRGRLGTPSSEAALDMIQRSTFMKAQIIANRFDKKLMSLVCEFVHPMTRVHVNYGDAKKLFLLEAYDTSGEVVGQSILAAIADELHEYFTLPELRIMTLPELTSEINNRTVHNREGWVAQIPTPDGGFRRIKFKYIAYIGEMVKSKLSYKYLMNCIKNDRLDKMLITLPEEIRAVAYDMVREVVEATDLGFNGDLGYKSLYSLYTPNDGGIDYFRTVCRGYYRAVVTSSSQE